MTQAQGVNWAQILILIGVIAAVIFMFTIPNQISNKVNDAVDKIDIPQPVTPVVPTAEEIAAKIEVPTPKTGNLDDVLEGVYPNEVRALENQCTRDLQDEFGDDVEDDVQDLIEEDLGEEIDDFRIISYNYDDDYNFNVLNLGLDDEDDREAELTSTLRVEYRLEDGDQDLVKDKVYSYAYCGDYDSEDNEFDDLDVKYSLSNVYA